MYEIRVHYANGYQPDSFTHLESTETRTYSTMAHADLTVPRTAFDRGEIEKGKDTAELRDDGEVLFAGVIEDVIRNDDTKTLKVVSWERLAERAEPTGPVEQWSAADATIIEDAIEDVGALEPGDIQRTNSSVAIVFSNNSQAYKARKAASLSPGFLRYNPDKTVDYGDFGRDLTHYTLSPRRQNVSTQYELDEHSGDEQVTHLRMLGAGEQEHQVSAEAVASSWEPGDEQVWKVLPDKSIDDQGALEQRAERLVDEMQTPLFDVTMTVKSVRCTLGDLFRVYIPSENIDETLRVVEHRRHIDNGTRHEVTLSNHVEAREDPDEKLRADTSNYNQAIEGAPMAIDGGGSRQPVGNDAVTGEDINWRTVYDYLPGVVHEHRVELKVEGDAYRAYSSGAAAGGGEHAHDVEISTTSADNADFESTVISYSQSNATGLSRQWTQIASIPVQVPTSKVSTHTTFTVSKRGGDTDVYGSVDFRLAITDTDGRVRYHPSADGAPSTINEPDNQLGVSYIELWEDLGTNEVNLEARLGSSYDGSWTISSRTAWQGAGRHTHDIEDSTTSESAIGEHGHLPEPGMTEVFGDRQLRYHPSGCSVIVNGQTIAGGLGDPTGEWTETIDLKGVLNEGDNTIEITSETKGHIQAFLQGEAVRRILGRGA